MRLEVELRSGVGSERWGSGRRRRRTRVPARGEKGREKGCGSGNGGAAAKGGMAERGAANPAGARAVWPELGRIKRRVGERLRGGASYRGGSRGYGGDGWLAGSGFGSGTRWWLEGVRDQRDKEMPIGGCGVGSRGGQGLK